MESLKIGFVRIGLAALLSAQMVFAPVLANANPSKTAVRKPLKAKLNSFPSSIYFTVAPNVELTGPVLDSNNPDDYLKAVLGTIVKKAHEAAKDMYSFGDESGNLYYYTFMILALTVPHHESQLMHARKTVSASCNQVTNSLQKISRENVRNRMKFFYRDPEVPIFPNCSMVYGDPVVSQVLTSGNHDDLGIMQINPYFHPDTLLPSVLLNTYSAIDYGVKYLDKQFRKVYQRAERHKYSCMGLQSILSKNLKSKTVTRGKKTFNPDLFWNLIRGTWGGGYNQGNVEAGGVCRITTNHLNDNGFLKSLEAVVYDRTSIYEKLPEDSVEKKAFNDILSNFRSFFSPESQVEKTLNIRQVIHFTSYGDDGDYTYSPVAHPNKHEIKDNHFLTSGNIIYRRSPSTDPKQICGVIANNKGKKPQIKVLGKFEHKDQYTNKIDSFALIQLPRFALSHTGFRMSPECNKVDYFYVRSDLLVETKPTKILGNDTFTIVNEAGDVRITQNASTNKIVGYLKAGHSAQVVGLESNRTGQWYRIISDTKVTGYIKADSIAAESVKKE